MNIVYVLLLLFFSVKNILILEILQSGKVAWVFILFFRCWSLSQYSLLAISATLFLWVPAIWTLLPNNEHKPTRFMLPLLLLHSILVFRRFIKMLWRELNYFIILYAISKSFVSSSTITHEPTFKQETNVWFSCQLSFIMCYSVAEPCRPSQTIVQ